MLNEYFQLGNRIRKHYVSPGVILCLITGRFVPPIHRKNLYSLQYSMLPAQRVGIYDLWKSLVERDKVAAREWDGGTGNGYLHSNGGGGVPYLRRGGGGR
jgi:phosphatidylinositol N-acetylglucosaminyltransferase subunit Q